MSIDIRDLNNRLWEAADQLRANSKLRSSEYGPPVLGLIFLRYAEHRFQHVHENLSTKASEAGSRRKIEKADYQARGVLYLPKSARFSALLALPEGENLGKAVNEAHRGGDSRVEGRPPEDVPPARQQHHRHTGPCSAQPGRITCGARREPVNVSIIGWIQGQQHGAGVPDFLNRQTIPACEHEARAIIRP